MNGGMGNVIRQLPASERPVLARHFLALGQEDRRLRFGVPLNDAAISRYVEGIDFALDAVFGVTNDELQLLGAAHLARSSGHAELGVSVLAGHRGQGIGGALLERAHLHARNWGVRELFMHCLSENRQMLHLARKHGMEVVAASGESDAWLKLAPADAASHFGAVFAQRVALWDFALKSQSALARRLAEALAPSSASPSR
jgi:GNAT superfamily N-acetyltransferase